MSQTQNDSRSVHSALDALHRTTGLHARLNEQTATGHDGHIEIGIEDGLAFHLPYKFKPTIDRRDQLTMFKASHDNAVLVTRPLSHSMAEQCRKSEIQFVDLAGNCFLRQPGLLVFVSGIKDTTQVKLGAVRGITPAALRLVFAILTKPSVLNSSVRRIAEVASISNGAAGAALVMLEDIGLFTTLRANRRVLAAPERWLETWTEGYLGRIRPKLEKYKMSASSPLSEVLARVNPRYREVVLGGEAAAACLNMGLKPAALTLYVDLKDPTVMRELVQEFKLHQDHEGKIELVEMFWNTQELESFPTVPDALIYADLVGTADSRSMEIAATLKRKICDYVESEA
jgi:hypothetical protein